VEKKKIRMLIPVRVYMMGCQDDGDMTLEANTKAVGNQLP